MGQRMNPGFDTNPEERLAGRAGCQASEHVGDRAADHAGDPAGGQLGDHAGDRAGDHVGQHTGDDATDDAGRLLPAPEPARALREPPWRGEVLVIAPHPDDESAGPGGALAQHSRRGDRVAVVFVTNGVHGDPTGEADPASYVALRRAEAEAACDQLGLGEREFWGFPDGCAVSAADLAAVEERLLDVLQRRRPAVVYAPHEGESHADHHFIGVATRRAVRRLDSPPVLLGYEVWSPQAAGFVLDVTDVYPTKRAAVGCYASQLRHTDILTAIEGLNTYRAILLPYQDACPGSRAEVYQELL